ncbi:hypothetical protein [Rubrolithibacter danxiaensis]|uniref:hypothetical protein n=1 Tax=Rubrolithibacter danxiaensis TaxID=3390805 RepID=UPI003BF7B18B
MKRSIYFFILLAVFWINSCSSGINTGDLYGEWKYLKVEELHDPSQNLSAQEVAEQSPSIRFSEDGKLVIMWGGKILSHGKFKMEGNIIRYTEDLPGGTTRPIPFLIKEINSKKLVFETMAQESTRITAEKID